MIRFITCFHQKAWNEVVLERLTFHENLNMASGGKIKQCVSKLPHKICNSRYHFEPSCIIKHQKLNFVATWWWNSKSISIQSKFCKFVWYAVILFFTTLVHIRASPKYAAMLADVIKLILQSINFCLWGKMSQCTGFCWNISTSSILRLTATTHDTSDGRTNWRLSIESENDSDHKNWSYPRSFCVLYIPALT